MKYDENDVEALRNILVGRSVDSVQMVDEQVTKDWWSESAEGKVILDDGTELLLGGNCGGCSCGAGDYYLTRLNDMPINGITNVEVVVEDRDGNPYSDSHTYRIFVLAQDERFELAAFDGDDGNGYYGTGFWFTVKGINND